jgi:GTPase SAR1 family protein
MRDNHGFVLVYAINDANSFSEVQDMYEQLRKAKDSDSVPVVLVGNKCDLPADERIIAKNEGERLASSWGNAKFFEASAKNRVNIVESFAQLVRLIRSENEEVPELDVKQTGATTKVPKQKKGLFSSSTSDADKKSDLIV